MATTNANFSWNINNPSVAGTYPVTASTDNMAAQPTVSSVFVSSSNPSSGSATAGVDSYNVQQVPSDGTVRWKVVVNVTLSNVVAGGNGMATGSGQVEVDY